MGRDHRDDTNGFGTGWWLFLVSTLICFSALGRLEPIVILSS